MSPRILRDTLKGKSVVVFRTPDAARRRRRRADPVRRRGRRHGHRARSTLTQQFVDANSAEKLCRWSTRRSCPRVAQLSTKLVDQGSQAGDLLGIALLTGREPGAPAVDDTQRDTVLATLRDTGFIDLRRTSTSVPRTPR